MEPLPLVAALLILALPSHQAPERDDLEQSTSSKEALNNKMPAEYKKTDSFDDFVEDKLVEHSQALEHILRMIQQNADVTKQLVENLSTKLDNSNMPEKVEVPLPTRRFISNVSESSDPFEIFNDKLPRYGNFIKNLAVKEFSHDSVPNVLIEESYKP